MNTLTAKVIDDAMCSSIENYFMEVIDSIEFSLKRELTNEEHEQVYTTIEKKINEVTHV